MNEKDKKFTETLVAVTAATVDTFREELKDDFDGMIIVLRVKEGEKERNCLIPVVEDVDEIPHILFKAFLSSLKMLKHSGLREKVEMERTLEKFKDMLNDEKDSSNDKD